MSSRRQRDVQRSRLRARPPVCARIHAGSGCLHRASGADLQLEVRNGRGARSRRTSSGRGLTVSRIHRILVQPGLVQE